MSMNELLEVQVVLSPCDPILQSEEAQEQSDLQHFVAVPLVPCLVSADDVPGSSVGALLEAREGLENVAANALVAHIAPSLLEGRDEILVQGHPVRDPRIPSFVIVFVDCFERQRNGKMIGRNEIVVCHFLFA